MFWMRADGHQSKLSKGRGGRGGGGILERKVGGQRAEGRRVGGKARIPTFLEKLQFEKLAAQMLLQSWLENFWFLVLTILGLDIYKNLCNLTHSSGKLLRM